MGTKVPTTDLTNLENETTAVAAINANFQAISDALDDTHYRDGTGAASANALVTDLDMNSNRILNLPAPTTAAEAARHGDLDQYVTDSETAQTAAEAAQTAAESAQTAAQSAQTGAESAETGALAAQTAAEVAQVAAELAESNAEAIAAFTLNGLTDVTITAVADNDLLEYDSGTAEWVNVTRAATKTALGVPVNIDDLTDVVITSVADEEVLQYDTGTSKWVNAALAAASGVPPHNQPMYQHAGVYLGPEMFTISATNSATANRLYMVPIVVPQAFTIGSMALAVNTPNAGQNCRMGIYSPRATGYGPGVLLADFGASTLASTPTVISGLTQAVTTGIYWLAVNLDSATSLRTSALNGHVGIVFASSNAYPGSGAYRALAYGAMPADETAETYTVDASNMPILGVRP